MSGIPTEIWQGICELGTRPLHDNVVVFILSHIHARLTDWRGTAGKPPLTPAARGVAGAVLSGVGCPGDRRTVAPSAPAGSRVCRALARATRDRTVAPPADGYGGAVYREGLEVITSFSTKMKANAKPISIIQLSEN